MKHFFNTNIKFGSNSSAWWYIGQCCPLTAERLPAKIPAEGLSVCMSSLGPAWVSCGYAS